MNPDLEKNYFTGTVAGASTVTLDKCSWYHQILKKSKKKRNSSLRLMDSKHIYFKYFSNTYFQSRLVIVLSVRKGCCFNFTANA